MEVKLNMKKILSLLCAGAILVTAAGCGGEKVDRAATAPKVVSDTFTFTSGTFALNAVYTFIDDGEPHPTVLLIAGSGPADCDETIGSLKPLADIADGLAERGINSLRVEKRTLNYGTAFAPTDGIEEKYLIDCRAALDYAKSQASAGDIYILGHSFGGPIASVLASENRDIKGVVLFNSSVRNLAAIACDQYIRLDPENGSSYITYRDAAMNSTSETSAGLYYYGETDHYWATVNQVDTIRNLKNANVPLLIINSTFDNQTFPDDIALWQDNFGSADNAKIVVDDKISHFGYEIDTTDESVFLSEAEFPQRIIEMFAAFVIR
jgi:Lysophospholipase